MSKIPVISEKKDIGGVVESWMHQEINQASGLQRAVYEFIQLPTLLNFMHATPHHPASGKVSKLDILLVALVLWHGKAGISMEL